MNDNMQEFVDSVESKNTQKVIRFVFKDIGDDNIENYGVMEMEQLILDKKPSSYKEIITIVYVLSSYFKYLQEQDVIKNDNAYQIVQSLDKKMLWKKAKPQAKKKFINFNEYKEIVKAIETYEEHNALYYSLLFQCVYEGIYNQDLSVLKNLRRNDIGEGVIILTEDNQHIYKIKVSEKLCNDLIKLSDVNVWYRNNRFGICSVPMRGVYPNSVFCIESRNTSSDGSYKFTYYSKLRKISSEYIGHTISPLCLFVSGVMHRIKVELNKNEISLKEAFADNSRNRMAHLIISKELVRCNNNIEIGNFRELVKGHLESFE